MTNSHKHIVVALLVGNLAAGQVSASPQARDQLSAPVLELARQCASNIHPLTLGYIVAVESANNRYAIGVNGGYRLPRQPRTREEAIETARWLESNGYNFDVGLGQINSKNFSALGVTAESIFDECTNLRSAGVILSECYGRAAKVVGEGQPALQRALSCYNTGSQTRGFANGYVDKIITSATKLQVPALSSGKIMPNPDAKQSNEKSASQPDYESRRGIPDVFSKSAKGAFSKRAPEANQQNTDERLERRNADLSNSSTPAGGTVQ